MAKAVVDRFSQAVALIRHKRASRARSLRASARIEAVVRGASTLVPRWRRTAPTAESHAAPIAQEDEPGAPPARSLRDKRDRRAADRGVIAIDGSETRARWREEYRADREAIIPGLVARGGPRKGHVPRASVSGRRRSGRAARRAGSQSGSRAGGTWAFRPTWGDRQDAPGEATGPALCGPLVPSHE